MDQRIDITYKVYYTDDLNQKRTKVLRLLKTEGEIYFFYNPRTRKVEAIPVRLINRMEEVKE